jgi:4-hydroxy-tetrahydrodipicolinate synthase
VADTCRLALAGEWNEARRVHLSMLPIYEAMFVEASPGPVKFALSQRGRIKASVRLPLVPPSDAARATIVETIKKYEPGT